MSGRVCDICKKEFREYLIDEHHIDGNPLNDDPQNIRLMCAICHRDLHVIHAEEFSKLKSERLSIINSVKSQFPEKKFIYRKLKRKQNGITNITVVLLLLMALCVGIVSAEPPKIVMKVNPTTGDAPLTITVSEDSGDKTIITWLWNFGDGGSLDKPSGEYTYDKVGEYELILSVWNDKEEVSTEKVTIVVTDPTPIETPTPTPTATPTPKPTMNETTTVKVVYDGATPIKDSLASPSKTSSDAVILKTATEDVMSKVSYPYNITKEETKTTFKIVKYSCKGSHCQYWVEAWRDGKEVYTNSPIGISPPPYLAKVSEVYDEETNEITTTLKEDPKLAVEQILQEYVNNQPLGNAWVDKE